MYQTKTIATFTIILFGFILLGWLALQQPTAKASPPYHGTPQPHTTPRVASTNMPNQRIPTYVEDVEPIVREKCVSCHVVGEIGYSEFAIDTYQDILLNAEDIAYYVNVGYMPPWPPQGDSVAFQHDRSLSHAEIQLIVDWEANGAPLGDLEKRDSQALAYTPGIAPQMRADLVLTAAPYTPDDRATDGYRCFLLDPQFTRDTYITGYQLIPSAPSIVHHMIAYHASSRVRAEAQQKEAEDGLPGWECYGGPNLSGGAGGFSTSIGDWGPGSQARPHAAQTGTLMPSGDLIILQVHYNLTGGTATDQTKLILQLAEPEETVHALRTLPLLAPVEIPCPLGVEGEQCQRDYAIEHADSGIAWWVFWRCGKTLGDYADQTADHAATTCDYTAYEDGYIVRVAGHMHALGTSFKIELNPDSPKATTLLDIPIWDFDWQSDYVLVTPQRVERGATVRVSCTWDNSEGRRYIVWGERTQDEMCLGRIIYVPLADLDEAQFLADYAATQNPPRELEASHN